MDSSQKTLLNEANVKAFHSAFTSPNKEYDDDDDHDNDNNDNDEDNTARLNRISHFRNGDGNGNENDLALQRVKSLTQRNRMVRI